MKRFPLPHAFFAVVLSLLVFAKSSAQDAGSAKYEETLTKLLETMDQMTKTLVLIVDEDTAKANKSVLRVQAESFAEIRKQSQEFSPPTPEAREKLAEKFRPEFEKGRKTLLAEIARVQRVPGGNASLQELRIVFEKDEKK